MTIVSSPARNITHSAPIKMMSCLPSSIDLAAAPKADRVLGIARPATCPVGDPRGRVWPARACTDQQRSSVQRSGSRDIFHGGRIEAMCHVRSSIRSTVQRKAPNTIRISAVRKTTHATPTQMMRSLLSRTLSGNTRCRLVTGGADTSRRLWLRHAGSDPGLIRTQPVSQLGAARYVPTD